MRNDDVSPTATTVPDMPAEWSSRKSLGFSLQQTRIYGRRKSLRPLRMKRRRQSVSAARFHICFRLTTNPPRAVRPKHWEWIGPGGWSRSAGELLRATRALLILPADLDFEVDFAYVQILKPKSAARRGPRRQHVTVEHPGAARLLSEACLDLDP